MRARRWLKRLTIALSAAALLVAAAGVWLSRPAAVRARLDELIARHSLPDIAPEQIYFTPWDGIVAHGVHVPAGSSFDLAASIQTVRVRVALWPLLRGRFEPVALEFDGVQADLTLAGSPLDERHGISRGIDALGELELRPEAWPRLSVRNADLRLFAADPAGGARITKRMVFDARGRAAAPGYALTVWQTSGSGLRGPAREPRRPALEARIAADHTELTTDWADLYWLGPLLPPALRACAPSGRVRLERGAWRDGRLVDASLRLHALALSAPVEVEASPAERYLRLDDAEGEIRWSMGPGPDPAAADPTDQIAIAGELRGRVLGGEGAATFALRGTPPAPAEQDAWRPSETQLTVAATGITFPDTRRHADFIASPRLPGPLRAFLEDYLPAGAADVELVIEDGPDGRRTAGTLRPRGASCRYFRFPYEVRDVQGLVRFSSEDGIRFERLSGVHGTTQIAGSGHLRTTDQWTGFELTFDAHQVGLNRDLYEALPPEYRTLWRQTNPVGRADVRVRITRDHGSAAQGPLEPHIETAARLRGVSLTFDDQRLHEATGLVVIRDERIELTDLHARRERADLALDGVIENNGDAGEAPHYRVNVSANGIAFDYDVRPRSRGGDLLGEIHFQGRGDVRGRRLRTAGGSSEEYEVEVRDGTLRGFAPDVIWREARGRLQVRPDGVRVEQLRADGTDSSITLRGDIPRDGHGAFDFTLAATGNRLERLTAGLTPPRWESLRRALSLSGPGEIEARLSGSPEPGAAGDRAQSARIRVRAAAMQPAPIPLELRDVESEITVNSDGFELHSSRAAYGERGTIDVHGKGAWGDDAWTALDVGFNGIDITPAFRRALPAGLRDLLVQTDASGRIGSTMEKLRLTRDANGIWTAQGRVALEAARLQVGLALEELRGELSGTVVAAPDRPAAVDARFVIDRARLAGREITDWQGQLLRAAGENDLRIENVSGAWCGGEIAGFGALDPRTRAYELSIMLNAVDLERFSRPPGAPGPRGRARVDGHVFLRGVAGVSGSREGGGALRLSDATLRSSPFTAELARAGQDARRPLGDRIEEAEARFSWKGARLDLTEVVIRTSNARLVGVGSFDTDQRTIDLTLITAPASGPALVVVSDLLELAREELMQYRIVGPIDAPRVTLEPLHNLGGPLRELLERIGG